MTHTEILLQIQSYLPDLNLNAANHRSGNISGMNYIRLIFQTTEAQEAAAKLLPARAQKRNDRYGISIMITPYTFKSQLVK